MSVHPVCSLNPKSFSQTWSSLRFLPRVSTGSSLCVVEVRRSSPSILERTARIRPHPAATPPNHLFIKQNPKHFPTTPQAISQNFLSLSYPNPKMELPQILVLLVLPPSPQKGLFYSFSIKFYYWPPHVLGLFAFFVVCDLMICLPSSVPHLIREKKKLLMSARFFCIPDVFSKPYFSHPIRRCSRVAETEWARFERIPACFGAFVLFVLSFIYWKKINIRTCQEDNRSQTSWGSVGRYITVMKPWVLWWMRTEELTEIVAGHYFCHVVGWFPRSPVSWVGLTVTERNSHAVMFPFDVVAFDTHLVR